MQVKKFSLIAGDSSIVLKNCHISNLLFPIFLACILFSGGPSSYVSDIHLSYVSCGNSKHCLLLIVNHHHITITLNEMLLLLIEYNIPVQVLLLKLGPSLSRTALYIGVRQVLISLFFT